jgi:hypothetical protein
MAWIRGLLLLALGAAAAVSADRLLIRPASSADAPPPEVSDSQPGPGDPPVVWLDGTLTEVTDAQLSVQEGRGPSIPVERFAAGATRFLRLAGDRWLELTEAETGALQAGQQACVEALLDGRTFLALRVFLGADCGPA